MSAKSTKVLLDFIVKEEKELIDYPTFKEILPRFFIIGKKGEGLADYTSELVDTIVDWESGNQNSSLEELLNSNFIIYERP